MFDLGWTELLLIGIVALIVVGPKDLPMLFRNIGRFVGKARGMAREFSSAMNEAADQSGMRDVAKGLKAAANPVSAAMDGVKEATRDLTEGLNPAKFDSSDLDPDSETGKLSAERAENARKVQAAVAARKAKKADKADKADKAKAAPGQDTESKT